MNFPALFLRFSLTLLALTLVAVMYMYASGCFHVNGYFLGGSL